MEEGFGGGERVELGVSKEMCEGWIVEKRKSDW
jgi:hypothetical protein